MSVWGKAAARFAPPPDPPGWLGSPGQVAGRVTDGKELQAAHLELIDEALINACQSGGRVLIEMPPRHGKSRRASRWGCAWFLARFPDRRVILTSYEADFAATWGRQVRDVIDTGRLGVRVARGSQAADRWDLADHDGGMVTAGVGGAITGRGAHLLIVDDPVKNHEEAHSQVMRDKAWDWWQSTALTRLEPDGAAVVIMTRWHADDLAGRILAAADADRWQVLHLPAIADTDRDLLGRQVGDALWPERYDREALSNIQAAVGTYAWSALYQGRPTAAEGGLFRRASFRYWSATSDGLWRLGDQQVRPDECWRFATCDLAASTKTSADWTVVAVWAVTPAGDVLLVDRVRSRLEEDAHFGAVRQLQERWRCAWVGVEATMHSSTLAVEMGRAGIPLMPLKADKDKLTRALPAQARIEAGRCWFPADAVWLDEWCDELLVFPNGKHDDQVDVLAYACRQLAVGYDQARVPVVRREPASLQERVDADLRARRLGARRHVGESGVLGVW